MLAALVTLWLITRHLSTSEQGFYYTFASIIGLQIVFELGMSNVVMQFASHEMARLSWRPDHILEGDEKAQSRLYSLFSLIARWYGVIAVLIIFVILPAGYYFFGKNAVAPSIAWEAAWTWLIVATAVNILLTPVFAMLEGCGHVTQIARLRMVQGIGGSIVCWGMLASGAGLLAMPAMSSVMAVIGLCWLCLSYTRFFKALGTHYFSTNKIDWKTEIWPLQWRIAISWLSGYFIFQFFVPVLFAYRGAIEAGQMGMSLSIVSAISTIAIAWVNTKAPQFGRLAALQHFHELDSLFFRILKQSTVVIVLGALCLLFIKLFLLHADHPLNARIMPLLPFVLLLLTTIVNHIVFGLAIYLRSYKEEPFMFFSLTMALLIAAASLLLTKRFGANGMMIAYFCLTLGIGLIWACWIFKTKRLEWQATKKGEQIV
ncbi:lipopolysaccharide biosynthesis protein [Undibacterium sp. TJN19]|uniref:lipopolysaccharide biosynthesis protein n=1 Tax=Undibacterium sp. TJN19 TaxID=3413055 RepID=UPI003BF35140